jgi:hypothetical protein
MSQLETIQNAIWALCLIAQAALLVFLWKHRTYRQYPGFTIYVLVNVVQGILLLLTRFLWGNRGALLYQVGWATQGFVLVARTFAVAELCRRILKSYRGIWALAWRLLTVCAAVIIAYSFLVANWRWDRAVLAADRGFELAIAGVIVLLFIFARYYGVPVAGPDRLLAVGFCLYSCAVVVNNTLLEKFFYQYYAFWNITTLIVYFLSLMTWIRAMRSPVSVAEKRPAMLEGTIYQELSPEINFRLRLLNEQLLSIWKTEAPPP